MLTTSIHAAPLMVLWVVSGAFSGTLRPDSERRHVIFSDAGLDGSSRSNITTKAGVAILPVHNEIGIQRRSDGSYVLSRFNERLNSYAIVTQLHSADGANLIELISIEWTTGTRETSCDRCQFSPSLR